MNKKLSLTVIIGLILIGIVSKIFADNNGPKVYKFGNNPPTYFDVVCRAVDIEGHRYLIGIGVEAMSMVHAESCPCKDLKK